MVEHHCEMHLEGMNEWIQMTHVWYVTLQHRRTYGWRIHQHILHMRKHGNAHSEYNPSEEVPNAEQSVVLHPKGANLIHQK